MILTNRHYMIAIVAFVSQMCLAVVYPSLSLQLLLGMFAVGCAWRACTERVGSLSAIGLYMVVSGLYVFAALLEVAFFGNTKNLDPKLMGALTDMGTAFLLAAGAGYLLLEKPGPRKDRRAPSSLQLQAAMGVCIGLLALSIALTVATTGFAVGSLSRSELYSQNLTFVSVIRVMLTVNLGVVAALLAAHERAAGRAYRGMRIALVGTFAVYTLIDLLILGDRRLALAAILAAAAHFMRKRFTWRQLLIGGVLAIMLFLFGFVRNSPPSTWWYTLTNGVIFEVISPTSTEFGGMAVIGSAIGSFSNQVWGFPGYLDAFVQIMPRALVPDRPLAPTEWFMTVFYPDLAAAGASYAFNQVIEARLNGGLAGLLLVGFATGCAIALLSRWRYLGASVGVSVAIFLFTFSMRMDFASILKLGLLSFAGLVPVLVLLALLAKPVAAYPGSRLVPRP